MRMKNGVAVSEDAGGVASRPIARVDLYWLPLGAGGHSVRLNGRVFEAVAARLEQRRPCDLYHSALVVRVPEGRFVIEQAPIRDGDGARARRRRRRRGRKPLGGALPDLPLRGAPLARRRHPRRRRGGREPAAAERRSRLRAAAARAGAAGADAGLGTRRAARRRDVELELADLVADRARGLAVESIQPRPADARQAGMPASSSRAASRRKQLSLN